MDDDVRGCLAPRRSTRLRNRNKAPTTTTTITKKYLARDTHEAFSRSDKRGNNNQNKNPKKKKTKRRGLTVYSSNTTTTEAQTATSFAIRDISNINSPKPSA